MTESRSARRLTNCQQVVLTLIARYYLATGEPCSIMYLARRLQKHPKTVRFHLAALARKGWAAPSAPAFQRVLH